jgi:hypothetical protein
MTLSTWIATALLAVSWLFGLEYYYPVRPWAWLAGIGAAVALLAASAPRRFNGGSVSGKSDLAAGPPPRRRAELVAALALLLPAIWLAGWPYRMPPLLLAIGLAIWLLPKRRGMERLASSLIAAGVVTLVQAAALELYAGWTMRSHDLPWPMPAGLAAVVAWLGVDATADGSAIVLHSTRQVHHLAATWELLMDPATWLFLIGGLAMLGQPWWDGYSCLPEEEGNVPGMAGKNVRPADPGFGGALGRPWRSRRRAAMWLTLVVLAWLPVRAALMISFYLHRVLIADPGRPLHAMNHFFSPWVLMVLLVAPALLAWRFVKLSAAFGKGAGGEGGEGFGAQGSGFGIRGSGARSTKYGVRSTEMPAHRPDPIPAESHAALRTPYSGRRTICETAAVALVALAAALVTSAIDWDPPGMRKAGRVMVVERHSEWSPTTKPYDTTWFVEPRLFGESSGYNYARIYRYLQQFYEMSQLLESDAIDDATLGRCDVLVIKMPTHRYSPEEVGAVRRFVARGGGLLMIGDHTNYEGLATTMNDIIRPMGFIYRDDLLFGFHYRDDPRLRPKALPNEQLNVNSAVPHPALERVPPMGFCVSCSIDPGWSGGRAAIANTGLWSMGPDYHAENYFPIPEHCPEMRYGAFVQLWAARHAAGRVLAFTDSTVFSNFCLGQPGKTELMLGMIEWLNRRSPWLDPRPWLLLLALPPLAVGCRMAGARRETWLALVAACACGWAAASWAVAAAQQRAMPTPECLRPQPCVVIDRTLSQVPLSQGEQTQGDGAGYGLFEQWIARLDCYTVRKEGAEEFSGDVLAVLCPSRPVTEEFQQRLERYVAAGGKLLVIDSPENKNSTADRLLGRFGLSFRRDRPWKGRLSTVAELPVVEVDSAWQVSGGKPIAALGQLPVAATAVFGRGSVTAIGFGSLWNDQRMGGDWGRQPSPEVEARYRVLFGLLRPLVSEKSPPAGKRPPDNSALKESGPADL